MTTTHASNLTTLIDQFGCEEKCRAYLEELRWPEGVSCIRCGKGVSKLSTRDRYECNACRYQFSVTAGTVMQDSKLPLWKWFLAIYVMGESKKGVSANQLKRMLGVSYKTAWYLCHRIRAAMGDGADRPLSGIVECDETWIGGKARRKGRGYVGNKAMVVGAVQRGGRICLKLRNRNDKKTLHAFVKDHVAPTAAAVYTDEHKGYVGIATPQRPHDSVNHSREEWVRGKVHTNSAESVWSLFKRSIVGSYHHLSIRHLPAYLDEMEWRFNNRTNAYLFRDTVVALMGSDVLGYGKLTASATQPAQAS